jgi:hypothetical protein
MFFLVRVAFWLTIVLALLPTGSSQPGAQGAQVGATEAVVAASAAVSDVSNFCERQPGACEVGAQAAVAIGQRAQAGAKMVYEFINDRMTHGETGSVEATRIAAHAVPSFAGSHSTLKPSDLEPTWRGPGRSEAVPLPRPRKDPRRKA